MIADSDERRRAPVQLGETPCRRRDVAALSYHIGLSASALALEGMNRLYQDFAGEGGDILLSIVLKLTSPDPYDLTNVDLSEYKGIVKPWNSWVAVENQCRDLALAVIDPA